MNMRLSCVWMRCQLSKEEIEKIENRIFDPAFDLELESGCRETKAIMMISILRRKKKTTNSFKR